MPLANPLAGPGMYSVPASAGSDPAVSGSLQTPLGGGTVVIDGTPVRVATFAAVAMFVVVGMRMAGFKFNVAI